MDYPTGPFQVTLNKRSASTLVVVDFRVSSWHSGGLAVFGISIDGGAAYDVFQCYINTPVAGSHMGWSGLRSFPGISVGSHTFKMQGKVNGGTLSCDGNDTFSMSVREVTG